MDTNDMSEENKFSDDPEEDLRLQNEFLKLKLMAESGAVFGGKEGIPPEIENQFLNNILAFEKQYSKAEQKKLKDIFDEPPFEPEDQLDDIAFAHSYKKLNSLLDKYSIQVHFNRERSDRFKYRFITTELFEEEIHFFMVDGMISHFSYEEFHPDHEIEIKDIAQQFLDDFLSRSLHAETYYIEDDIAEPDGKIYKREIFMKRFEAMYEATEAFEDCSYTIDEIDFELHEEDEEKASLGYAEGRITYTIVWPSGERKLIDGPFKVYLMRHYEVWRIYFFYLAGFNLNKR